MEPGLLPYLGSMSGAAYDGLVYIKVTVPDFEVESTVRVSTNPCFIVNRCALASKV